MSSHSPDKEIIPMTHIIRRSGKSGTSIGAILTAFALVCVLGGVTARAEDRGHDDRGRSARAPVRHHVEHRNVGYGYDAPSYGYSSPPIVYAPPAPSAGINLIIPLRFH
jgi:hypothetical protein